MEDLLENGIPQNPEGVEDTPIAYDANEDKNNREVKPSPASQPETELPVDQSEAEPTSRVIEVTPQSLGIKAQKVRRNFSVRMKVTNDCIIVTVMRTDSDDTLTFVNNIRW